MDYNQSINKFSKLFLEATYSGKCTNDNDIESLFGDATGFAQQQENAKEITKDKFLNTVKMIPSNIAKKNHEFKYYIYENGIYALHDLDDDIHYFWRV